jgi:PTS system galactitol-specific IIB component
MPTKAKVILVSCGTAVATSTVAAVAIGEAMKERGIPVQIRQCKTAEINSHLDGVDLIVTTARLTGTYKMPVIQTLAFLTGIGKADIINQIVKALQN